MNVSKVFASAAAALTIVGTAGLVFAQTTTNDAAPSTTTPGATTMPANRGTMPATEPTTPSTTMPSTMPATTPATPSSTDSSSSTGSTSSPSGNMAAPLGSSDTMATPGTEPAPRADRN